MNHSSVHQLEPELHVSVITMGNKTTVYIHVTLDAKSIFLLLNVQNP